VLRNRICLEAALPCRSNPDFFDHFRIKKRKLLRIIGLLYQESRVWQAFSKKFSLACPVRNGRNSDARRRKRVSEALAGVGEMAEENCDSRRAARREAERCRGFDWR
jgi:hypothetical protein